MLLSLLRAQLRGKRTKKKVSMTSREGVRHRDRGKLKEEVELFAVTREGCARNVRVPVGERTVRIVLPCPDVQRIESWQTETIGCVKQMEQLSHQLGR